MSVCLYKSLLEDTIALVQNKLYIYICISGCYFNP
jgi:hypothetical protein